MWPLAAMAAAAQAVIDGLRQSLAAALTELDDRRIAATIIP